MRRSTFVVLALLAASCGNKAAPLSTPSTESPATTASSPAATGCAGLASLTGQVTDKGTSTFATNRVTLEAGNDGAGAYSAAAYYFSPTCAKVHGGTITLTIKDAGNIPHNLTIPSLNINQDLAAGKSVRLTLKLPSSGVVSFHCEYHQNLGMQGAFVIV